MWELDCEESWVPKNWCFWTVVLEKTLESHLVCKEIQPVYPKGDQSWVFIGRPDAEAETPILWPSLAKSWLIGKDCDAGWDWGQEEKGTTEDEMAGWHHRLNCHESKWTPGVGDEQGGLACCDSWGRKESDMTERLNWSDWQVPFLLLQTGPRNPTALPPYTRGSLEKSKMRAGRYLFGQAFQPKNNEFLKKKKKVYIKIIRLRLLEWTPAFPPFLLPSRWYLSRTIRLIK